MTASTLLFPFLPFLLSLMGESGTAAMLCLLTSVLTLSVSADLYHAGTPWLAGMAMALTSVWERFRQRRAF